MTRLICRSCGEVHKAPFRPTPEDYTCDCGGSRALPSELKPRQQLARTSKPQKPRKGLKRTQRRESAAEKKGRLHFNKTVKAWPCWFRLHRRCERCGGSGDELYQGCGEWLSDVCPVCDGDGQHHCAGRKDAHHLVPKDFLRQRFEAVLPEQEFVAILFNPKIGAPVCRKAHDAIESASDRIYFEDLSEECLEYVSTLPEFVLMRLELECPKRALAERGAPA